MFLTNDKLKEHEYHKACNKEDWKEEELLKKFNDWDLQGNQIK